MITLERGLDDSAHQRSDGNGASSVEQHTFDTTLHDVVLQDLGDAADHGRTLRRDGAGVVWFAQPIADSGGQIGALQPLGHHGRGQEVVPDETAEALADLVLPGLDDGGVGNGKAKRMAKQSGHCEPIGQCPDHGCLGRGPDIAEPGGGVLHRAGDEEDHCGDHEHGGGHCLHPPQVAPTFECEWV